MTYNRFIQGLKAAEIEVDRRMLAELAVNDEAAFTALVEISKANQPAFDQAIEEVAGVASRLIDSLVTNAEPRQRVHYEHTRKQPRCEAAIEHWLDRDVMGDCRAHSAQHAHHSNERAEVGQNRRPDYEV